MSIPPKIILALIGCFWANSQKCCETVFLVFQTAIPSIAPKQMPNNINTQNIHHIPNRAAGIINPPNISNTKITWLILSSLCVHHLFLNFKHLIKIQL